MVSKINYLTNGNWLENSSVNTADQLSLNPCYRPF